MRCLVLRHTASDHSQSNGFELMYVTRSQFPILLLASCAHNIPLCFACLDGSRWSRDIRQWCLRLILNRGCWTFQNMMLLRWHIFYSKGYSHPWALIDHWNQFLKPIRKSANSLRSSGEGVSRVGWRYLGNRVNYFLFFFSLFCLFLQLEKPVLRQNLGS